jgi:hypothetical protein
MLGFECKTQAECRTYHFAIATVLKKLTHFFPSGRHDSCRDYEPCYHAWEIWCDKVTGKDLQALLPEIEKEVNCLPKA